MQPREAKPRTAAVLWDLDGTLADTAGDFAAAGNSMRACRSLPPLSVDEYRGVARHGGRGAVRTALRLPADSPVDPALLEEFFVAYESTLCVHTKLYPNIGAILAGLAESGVAWGIVTNKAARFAVPLVQRLDLQPDVLIAGDTTAHRKPHPAPIHAALRSLCLPASACVFVGDDEPDVAAAKAAGVGSIRVTYGYGVPTPDMARGRQVGCTAELFDALMSLLIDAHDSYSDFTKRCP